jgi:uncharacterized membrane protein YfcA
MELLVNTLIGILVLIFDVVRGLLEWGGKALLTGLGAGAGAYFGVRAAHAGHADTAGMRD